MSALLAALHEWLTPGVVVIITGVSLATLLLSLLAMPWLLARLPVTMLLSPPRPAAPRHPVVWFLRNVAGALIFLAGVVMLIGPGQGVLAMIGGLLLMDFPGKHRLERTLLTRPTVMRGVNALRARAHAPPLLLPSTETPLATDAADSAKKAPPEGDGGER